MMPKARYQAKGSMSKSVAAMKRLVKMAISGRIGNNGILKRSFRIWSLLAEIDGRDIHEYEQEQYQDVGGGSHLVDGQQYDHHYYDDGAEEQRCRRGMPFWMQFAEHRRKVAIATHGERHPGGGEDDGVHRGDGPDDHPYRYQG